MLQRNSLINYRLLMNLFGNIEFYIKKIDEVKNNFMRILVFLPYKVKIVRLILC